MAAGTDLRPRGGRTSPCAALTPAAVESHYDWGMFMLWMLAGWGFAVFGTLCVAFIRESGPKDAVFLTLCAGLWPIALAGALLYLIGARLMVLPEEEVPEPLEEAEEGPPFGGRPML